MTDFKIADSIESYLTNAEDLFVVFENSRKANFDSDIQKVAFTALYLQNKAIIKLLKQELKQIDEMKEYVSSLQHQLVDSKVPYAI